MSEGVVGNTGTAEEGALRVGVYWPGLAGQADQLERIAAAAGTAPVVWNEGAPPPDVEALVGGGAPETVPEGTPRLRLFQSVSAGADWLVDHPLWRSEVILCTASGVHGVQIPEHVMLLLLALRRHLPEYLSAQRRHIWRHDAVGDGGVSIAPRELYGQTLGLVGYGHIGRGVAHLARAFGMRVLAVTPSAKEETPLDLTATAPFVDPPALPRPELGPDLMLPLADLPRLLAASDAVVVCVPLTPQTKGLIDATALGQMKPGALLVNIARGSIIDEDALLRALRDGRLAGAGLDVTTEEPLPASSPLWEMPQVIITPHVSGQSEHYAERAVNILLANLDRLRRGEQLLNVVDRARGY